MSTREQLDRWRTLLAEATADLAPAACVRTFFKEEHRGALEQLEQLEEELGEAYQAELLAERRSA